MGIYMFGMGVDPIEQKYALILDDGKTGDITEVPKYIYGSTNNSSSFSTRFLQKGLYPAEKYTIGYNLNPRVSSMMHLSSLKFYVREQIFSLKHTIRIWPLIRNREWIFIELDIYDSKTITVGWI